MSDSVSNDLSIYCQRCRQAYRERFGDFLIRCSGIVPADSIVPQKILRTLKPEERDMVLGLYDPVFWAKRFLNWEPRVASDGTPYQELMLRCTAHRKVFRCGRRVGKTHTIAVKILHLMTTHEYSKVLLVTPFKAQIELIFRFVREHIAKSPLLERSVKRSVANPYHELEFYNGSYLRGFTSGARSGSEAASIRGQAADIIVLDEMDFLADGDINTITAILHDHAETQLWASSTPTGRRGKFWEYCNSPRFKEFHFPATCLPHWSEEMEQEAREQRTELEYLHEIMAEFGEEEEGVFQKRYIEMATRDYTYQQCTPQGGHLYGIGVDWNSDAYGTEIMVVGWVGTHLQVVDSVNVGRSGWSQHAAINAIVAANRKWQPIFIYADEGFGSTQIEILRKFGYERAGFNNVDARLKDIVVGVNFSSHIEIQDPVTRQPIKKPMKPFMVENAIRIFERNQIHISAHDLQLLEQLENYIIKRRTEAGMPVYAPRSARIGDHKLDALMLALLGFAQRLGELAVTAPAEVYFVNHWLREQVATQHILQQAGPYTPTHPDAHARRVRYLEAYNRQEISPLAISPQAFPNGLWGHRMVSWPGWLRDEPPPAASPRRRRNNIPSRRLF